MNLLIKCVVYCFLCRDVQKQKALVKNESLLTILSGETLQFVPAHHSNEKELVSFFICFSSDIPISTHWRKTMSFFLETGFTIWRKLCFWLQVLMSQYLSLC